MKNTIAGARRRPGYTLLEIMAVVVILTILAVKAAPRMAALLDKSKAAECLANRTILERAEERYRLDHGDQPSASLDALYQARYIDRAPKCSSGGQYIWISTAAPVNMGCTVHDWPYPVTTGPAALYASDFNDMTGLTALMGGWNTAEGKLSNTTTGSEARIAFGSASWTDYSITATAILSKGAGYGIYYRADGKANISGYSFQYDQLFNSFLVRKVVNGVESNPFQTVAIPAGFPIYSTPHQITINVAGAVQKIYVDNTLVLSFSDSTFAAGGAGFRTWRDAQASFDSVQVTQP